MHGSEIGSHGIGFFVLLSFFPLFLFFFFLARPVFVRLYSMYVDFGFVLRWIWGQRRIVTVPYPA